MPRLQLDLDGAKPQDLPLTGFITELFDRYRQNFDGRVADYIPELGKADTSKFGIVLATADGFTYPAGAADHVFTIQSVSKPLVYALALEDHGLSHVQKKIGVEPSGDPFNSITFDERHNRPFNPMVNAGAIAAVSLVKGSNHAERFERILGMFERFFGRKPTLDEAVYVSERETGHRNRAIGYLALNSGMIDGPLDDHLDLYFRQCSIKVTARDLSIAAATLANDGINPLTGTRTIKSEHVRAVLSVMSTCGMYDYAGEWQFDVGLPAKSGVSGGIMAVLPGQLGLGLYSPLVDEVGNSVRGVKVCEDLSRMFRLHLLEQRASAKTAIRRRYLGSDVRSKRVRRVDDARKLDVLGREIEVIELQGDLLFAEAEKVSRRIIHDSASVSYFVMDTERAFRIDPVAFDLLCSVRKTLAEQGKHLVLTGQDCFASWAPDVSSVVPHWLPNVDQALEYFENLLLDAPSNTPALVPADLTLRDFDVLSGFSADAIAVIQALTQTVAFKAGERLIKINTPADGLFLLLSGRVDVSVPLAGGSGAYRVSTIDPGNVFGELALFDAHPRTADIVAAVPGEALVLTSTALQTLHDTRLDIYSQLVLAIGRSLAARLRRANDEIRALAR